MLSVGLEILGGMAGKTPEQDTSYPTPESKTHKGTPTHAGIGIERPSPHIPPYQVDPEFFSSRSVPEFFPTIFGIKIEVVKGLPENFWVMVPSKNFPTKGCMEISL